MQLTLEQQADQLATHDLYGFLYPEGANGEGVALELFFLRQDRSTAERDFSFAWVPTTYIAMLVAAKLQAVGERKQVRFFADMSTHTLSSNAPKWIFEAWLHTRLLDAVPLLCLGLSSTHPASRDYLPTLGTDTVIRGPIEILQFCSTSKPFYWKPSIPRSNSPGIDTLLFVGHSIFAIQSTISIRKYRNV